MQTGVEKQNPFNRMLKRLGYSVAGTVILGGGLAIIGNGLYQLNADIQQGIANKVVATQGGPSAFEVAQLQRSNCQIIANQAALAAKLGVTLPRPSPSLLSDPCVGK